VLAVVSVARLAVMLAVVVLLAVFLHTSRSKSSSALGHEIVTVTMPGLATFSWKWSQIRLIGSVAPGGQSVGYGGGT
jgi:hypothetical protein